ncbi:MAG: NfeD family protein [Bacteroidales bacterium]
MKKYLLLIFLSFMVLCYTKTYANNYKKIRTFEFHYEVGSTSHRLFSRALEEAVSDTCDLLIIDLNTFGGTLKHADSIRTSILSSKLPIWVFINNNAASAGALISIACDSIFMVSSATIGAATVVNGMDGQALPDKYQSRMRAMMRATAESHGKVDGKWFRDPDIAEAMVDQNLSVAGVSDSGNVLTLTAEEAVDLRYCEGVRSGMNDVLERAGIDIDDSEVSQFKPTTMDTLIGWLIKPSVSGILISIIVLGIFTEIRTPGIGVPLVFALIAAMLYFAPLYIEGFASNWEIILFAIGVILIALEMFVISGFGLAGILGIICMFTGLIFSLLNNDIFNFEPVDTSRVGVAFSSLIISLLIGVGGLSLLFAKLLSNKQGFFGRVALHNSIDSNASTAEAIYNKGSETLGTIVGEKGVASSWLHPIGTVIIKERIYNAVAIHNKFIEKGKTVLVLRVQGNDLVVKEIHYCPVKNY